jgi:hypothetical protein
MCFLLSFDFLDGSYLLWVPIMANNMGVNSSGDQRTSAFVVFAFTKNSSCHKSPF